MARGSSARGTSRGGERIQASRTARVVTGTAAVAAYCGVLADVLARAGSTAPLLVPSAALGLLALLYALLYSGRGLGVALWLGAGTYVAFVVHVEHEVDATAPLVAVLLLLCGELAAWSLDERWQIRAQPQLALRRGVALAALALAGLAAAALVVALSAVPPSHGLLWTIAGAAAAVGAAGTGVWVARR
jgi:hypothetical protein